eukprot:GILI01030752.1.p1 GENE.GILI01030752.1~~GILI01030752.1.p1  ORF type:complete len:228 (+),score=33.10 GILI01030752.1:26-685(+)
MTFGLVSPGYLVLDFDSMLWQLQMWRVLTGTVFLGKFGFPWLMNIATLYLHLKNHEEGDLKGKRADLVWMIMCIVSVLMIAAYLLAMPLVSMSFIMAICWVWCRRNPKALLSIYMFKFEANYFPWALVVFHLLLGMNIVDDIVGIVAGHAFVFFKDILPKTHNKDFIPTPRWLTHYFPYERLNPYTVNEPLARAQGQGQGQQPQAPAGHNWGAGRQLGR